MKRIATIGIVATIILVSSASILYINLAKNKRQVMVCNYDTTIRVESQNVVIQEKVNAFYYADNTGFRKEFGTASVQGKTYRISREVNFEYHDADNDDMYTIKYTNIVKGPIDNTPDELWGKYKGNSYYSFYRLNNELMLITESGRPVVICANP